MTLCLAKADNRLVSFCKCDAKDALIALPGQLDCPWCGCGYLFSCVHCRKSFTFAVAVESPLSLVDLAKRDMTTFWGKSPTAQEAEKAAAAMGQMLKDIVLGQRYVYLDGHVHRADASSLLFRGLHGSHSLLHVPHTEAGDDKMSLMRSFSREYWTRAQKRLALPS